MTPCPDQLTRLTALVDGALSIREAELVHAHLVHCAGCRAEVAELRSLRGWLAGRRDSAAGSTAPGDLSARLVGIAGESASDPLWTRTFHRSGEASRPRLPHSERRLRRRRVARASAGVAGAAVVAVAIGWSAAPPTRTANVDPSAAARTEFAGALNRAPLANQAVAAATMADVPSSQADTVDSPSASGAETLGDDPSRHLLNHAAAASRTTTLQGEQEVQVRHRAGYWVTEVAVRSQAGQGLELQVGKDTASRFVAVDDSAVGDPGGSYQLSGGQEAVVAGRPATVVTARAHGREAARWWLDRDQGFLLWQETYGTSGEVIQSSGFTSVEVAAGETPMLNHLPPRLAVGQNQAALSVAQSPQLNSVGWTCAESLAGMSLVQVEADRGDAPGQVQTVYSDGVHTVSVLQQRGALTRPPGGFVWDPEVGTYRNVGMTTMLAWQSSDTVFTVATDGGPELARRVMEQLPHQAPVLRTRTDRVAEGWLRIRHAVFGR